MAPGVVVEFSARRTEMSPERPHGISYAFVLRQKDGGGRGCDSTTPTLLTKAEGIGASAPLTITGTEQRRIKAAPTTLRRPFSYSMIFGMR
jgi:hypothetical protein